VKHDLLGLLKRVLEVDEVEHEVADSIEDDILSEHLGNPHGAPRLLLVIRLAIRAAPEPALERLAEVVDVANKRVCVLGQRGFVVFLVLVEAALLVLLLGDSLLELEVKHLLEDTLPNVLLLPDAMVVDERVQVYLLILQLLLVFTCRPRLLLLNRCLYLLSQLLFEGSFLLFLERVRRLLQGEHWVTLLVVDVHA